uniref:Reticuline 7-O-methyltransferase-like protein n=1 Tax=Papaver bracteatum TaxID=215227 RepID=C3SBW1_PAPBR|nr:reticuline 7-O-methyltransferase-like protein [Papaver bracteatum]
MDTAEERLKGQIEIWELTGAVIDSMALRCAVELGIPDIINSHGRPITISEIINSLKSTKASPNAEYLTRVMRLLVHNRVFTSQVHQESNQIVYNLTRSSKWLLKDSKFNLSPTVLFDTHPIIVKPWQYLGRCVQENGFPFERAHGREIWDLASADPKFNNLLNGAMGCTSTTIINEMLLGYKDGFSGIGSLVDVGGGTGTIIAEIVEANPHIIGTNLRPSTCGGYSAWIFQELSMLVVICLLTFPEADAVLMKWILHDWSDEDCTKILKKLYKAITKKKNGEVIIVECVLRPGGSGLFDKIGLIFDMGMLALTSGGKERTEDEWKMLLNNAGFPRYNIIQTPSCAYCIIVAFPE